MKKVAISLLTSSLILATNGLAEDKVVKKRVLKGNMNLSYKIIPHDVDSFYNMFAQGMTYGRLRMNTFKWDWADNKAGKDNYAVGIGGSLVFKTGRLNGFSATAGLYTSQNPFLTMDKENVGSLKAGKDTLSRNSAKDGNYGMAVLGESYIQYDFSKTTLKFGRQLFHSVFTKSNDTKMIPNSFDGLTLESKDIQDTKIQLAYFQAQKLRDHTDSHDVLTFNTKDGVKWDNNDDSAIHKGLSYSNFDKAGDSTEHNLYIATVKNESIDNLKAVVSYLTVPDVISNITLEAHYKINLYGWSLTHGLRYMIQNDDGGGKIGGASLKGKLANWKTGDDTRGYSNPNSLDSSLLAGRVVGQKGAFKILYGFSKIEDKADIVAPWRGFPTGGYTRAMAQYNWNANTSSQMIQASYNFGKAGIIDGFRSTIRYAIMDFDENKDDVVADRSIIHVDFWKTFRSIPNFETKIRIGVVDSESGGVKNKTDTSYNEYRLEFNYLF